MVIVVVGSLWPSSLSAPYGHRHRRLPMVIVIAIENAPSLTRTAFDCTAPPGGGTGTPTRTEVRTGERTNQTSRLLPAPRSQPSPFVRCRRLSPFKPPIPYHVMPTQPPCSQPLVCLPMPAKGPTTWIGLDIGNVLSHGTRLIPFIPSS